MNLENKENLLVFSKLKELWKPILDFFSWKKDPILTTTDSLIKKKSIRKQVLTQLRNQKEEDKLNKSHIICDKLFAIPEFQEAQTILFYASFDGEVETFTMIERAQAIGKKIALPKIRKDQKELIPTLIESLDDLTTGPYGIREPREDTSQPIEIKHINSVIVPGVVFDRNNNRLGRGGGYYDRFLKSLPKDTPTIGLAFDFQIVNDLPHLDPHDIPVSRIITN